MKVLIAISCYLAVVSAGYLGTAYHGVVAPHHVPVIGANGVPVEPAENVAARAAHAAAHAEARARNGDYYAAPYAYTGAVAAPVVAAATPVYAGPQHIPVIGANGVPVEPAANVAARAAHAAAHVEAKARNGDVAFAVTGPVAYSAAVTAPVVAGVTPYTYGTYGQYAYGQHVPVIGPNGVPLEPAANVAARAAHAASHVEAKVRNGDFAVLGRKRRGVFHGGVAAPYAYSAAFTPFYSGPQHIPVIGANGVPVEPAANVAARAAHAAAHVEAKTRNGDAAIVAPYGTVAVGVHPATTYPALAADGQPLETPEVVAAKAVHFSAHAEATARNYAGAIVAPIAYASPYAYTTGVVTNAGVPLDTPEVAAAKAAHFQAHINDKIAHGIL